jgi:hypothetical protein
VMDYVFSEAQCRQTKRPARRLRTPVAIQLVY